DALPPDTQTRQDRSRQAELQACLDELTAFDIRLQDVIQAGFSCAALAEDEPRYAPRSGDGVRVHIAPLQKAGLLAAEVLAVKDVDRAIEDRAEWRAAERRSSRDGKPSKPDWRI